MLRVSKIMVACDFSKHSKAALKFAAGLAENLKADLIVTHVINQRDVDAVQKVAGYSPIISVEEFTKNQKENRSLRIDKLIEETSVAHLSIKKVVRILPVMDKAKLLGIVTDRDLIRASASNTTNRQINETQNLASTIKVKEIMSRDPVTVPFDHTVEETAQILLNYKIPGMPVVNEEGNMVGAITQTDIFRAIISLTGVARRGIQFALDVEDRPGSIKVVSDIIREYGGRMASILTSYDLAPKGFRRVYIRMYGIDAFNLYGLKEALGEKARIIYMRDHPETRREIL